MIASAGIQGDAALLALLHEVLAPMVARDGGALGWVRRAGDTVEVSLGGACLGCPAQRDTVEGVLLPAMRAADPTVLAVRVVAARAVGNP
jgi:Fe-S cluster biogenesis protein NfuA